MLKELISRHQIIISDAMLTQLEDQFKRDFKKICYQLIDEYELKSDSLLAFFSEKYQFPTFNLNQFDPNSIKTSLFKTSDFLNHWFLPLIENEDELILGIISPTQIVPLNRLSVFFNKSLTFYLVDACELRKIIETHCQAQIWHEQIQTHSRTFSTIQTDWEMDSDPEEPVIQFVNQLIEQAIQKRISDIHLESLPSQYRLRFRQDGLLYSAGEIPTTLAQRVIARIKILAKLDVTEKRIPQDGRFQYESQTKIHIRVSSSPGVLGEKLVLRLLEGLHRDLSLTTLGLEENQLQLIQHHLIQPQGLILVAGATGSGKTMSLYAALKYLNTLERNICSVEDPVEIYLEGIHQVNVHDFIELNFSKVLRAFLRQDPDIIMIGEIRDAASAQVAVEAAQTGHLVLATLHTNNAQESITRFLNLGVPDYLLANALSLVISQRLVRTLCQKCKILDESISKTPWQNHFINPVYKALGCDYCKLGYHGRIGIFECLTLNADLVYAFASAKLSKNPFPHTHLNLWQAGLLKVNAGITSLDELYRVCGEPNATHEYIART